MNESSNGIPSAAWQELEAGAAAERTDVTRLLLLWRDGDPSAFDRLFPLVYQELRRLAHGKMLWEQGSRTLQTTALVHEAYLRLVDANVDWEGRSHFLSIAARVMRQVLVDEARRRRADKRGSGERPLTLGELDRQWVQDPDPVNRLLALDQAMSRLVGRDPRRSKVVELRFFGGLTIAETGKVLGLSHATVERDLKLGLAWLAREMSRGAPQAPREVS